jgi:acetyltransferase-like isoleucine patch superfamily enzyme
MSQITPPENRAYIADNKHITLYEKNIQTRTYFHYLLGLLARWKQHFKYAKARRIARRRGATIGEGAILPLSLARRANANLTVGAHTSIQTDLLDLRSPVTIGSHVIIGSGTDIITTSHYIDSPDWEHKHYGITIEDYVWIPTKVMVLPSCRKIGRGAVVSSGSVVVKDVAPMSVVGGNPAKEFKKRACVHSDLVVESLLGGDYEIYKQTWKNRQRR